MMQGWLVNQSESKTLLQRILAVMDDVSYIEKDTTVKVSSSSSYKAVSHDAVTAEIRASMINHGIVSWISGIESTDETIEIKTQYGEKAATLTKVAMKITYCSVDDKDDFIVTESLGYGLDSGDKGPGKAISYAKKYAHLKTFDLLTGEDSDYHASPDRPTRHNYQPETNEIDTQPTNWKTVQIHFGKLKGRALGTLDAKSMKWWSTEWLNKEVNTRKGEDLRLENALKAYIEELSQAADSVEQPF